jgi:hypothetical protein
MSEAELARVRQDLETIRQAAGLQLPFGRADVWQTLALVPGGLLLAAWAYFGPEPYLVLGLVPLLLVVLVAGYRHFGKLRGKGPTQAPLQEHTFDTISTLVVIAALAGYLIWEKKLGLPSSTVGGVACYFLGVLCAVLGLTHRNRRVYFAGALALIPFGLVIPLCTGKPMVTAVGGLALVVAGLAGAAILAWQLHVSRRDHEPATH